MSTQYLELKLEIIEACLRLDDAGYLLGIYGNVSARVPEGLLITPAGLDYKSLTPDDLVLISPTGDALEGKRPPCPELEVHRQIYLARADVGAIIHSHSPYATAASCLRKDIPVIVEEQSQVVGGEMRCTHYIPSGQPRELGEEAVRVLGDSNSLLLANHGTLSCGRLLQEALFVCMVAERVAQIYLFSSSAGTPVPILADFVKSERKNYLTRQDAPAGRAE